MGERGGGDARKRCGASAWVRTCGAVPPLPPGRDGRAAFHCVVPTRRSDEERAHEAHLAGALLVAPLLIAACSSDHGTGPGGGVVSPPEMYDAYYQWSHDGWQGLQPVGEASVVVSWLPPGDWTDEVFRVYGRRSGSPSTI